MFGLTRFLVRLLVRVSVHYILWTCARVDSVLGTRTAVLARVAVQLWVTLGSPPFLLMLDADTLGSSTTETVLIESSDEVDMSLRAESPTDSALPPSDRCSPINKCGSSGSPSYSDAEERFECDGEEEDFGVMDIGRPSLSSDSFRSQGSGGSGSGRRQLPQRNSWLRTSLRRSGSNRKQSSPLGGEPFQSLGSNPTLVVGRRSSGCFEAEDLQSLSERQQCVDDLSDKVLQLQSQVSALSDNLTSNGDLYRRVKQENASLVDR
ncbi:unnamed protein product [Ixodes persulcatus]